MYLNGAAHFTTVFQKPDNLATIHHSRLCRKVIIILYCHESFYHFIVLF